MLSGQYLHRPCGQPPTPRAGSDVSLFNSGENTTAPSVLVKAQRAGTGMNVVLPAAGRPVSAQIRFSNRPLAGQEIQIIAFRSKSENFVPLRIHPSRPSSVDRPPVPHHHDCYASLALRVPSLRVRTSLPSGCAASWVLGPPWVLGPSWVLGPRTGFSAHALGHGSRPTPWVLGPPSAREGREPSPRTVSAKHFAQSEYHRFFGRGA